MIKTKILDMENDGLDIAVSGQMLFIRNKSKIYKYDLSDFRECISNEILKKDGKSRKMSVFGDYIFFVDFLDLYIIDKNTLQVIDNLRLGENLSTDLGEVMWFDHPNAYIRVRNGWVYVLDIITKNTNKVKVCESSFWHLSWCITDNFLYAGTVTGELLEIKKDSLNVTCTKQLFKKNIYGVIYEDGFIYTAAPQPPDQAIAVIDAHTFETVCVAKKAISGMLHIFHVEGDNIYIKGNKVPLSAWDKKTLKPLGQTDFPIGIKLQDNSIITYDKTGLYKYSD